MSQCLDASISHQIEAASTHICVSANTSITWISSKFCRTSIANDYFIPIKPELLAFNVGTVRANAILVLAKTPTQNFLHRGAFFDASKRYSNTYFNCLFRLVSSTPLQFLTAK
jgi:hypothetical protein